MNEQLTANELEAIKGYAAWAGPKWKHRLSIDWMNAGSRFSGYGPLQAVRNRLGPRWLVKFELEDGPTLSVEAFVERLTKEAFADTGFSKDGAHGRVRAPTYEIDKGGRKYKRIVTVVDGCHQSVWGFIEVETGDIYKAAGWKGPAKHVRGNIATGVYGRHYNHFGPRYL